MEESLIIFQSIARLRRAFLVLKAERLTASAGGDGVRVVDGEFDGWLALGQNRVRSTFSPRRPGLLITELTR